MTPPAPMGACRHERLHFQSGGYYVCCHACGRVWVALKAMATGDDDLDHSAGQALLTPDDVRVARPQPTAGADLAGGVSLLRTLVREHQRNAVALGDDPDAQVHLDAARGIEAVISAALTPPASDARAVTDAQGWEIAEAWRDCVMHEAVDRYPGGVPGFVQRVTAALRNAGLLEDGNGR